MELEGRTVIVTRARGQNHDLRFALEDRGSDVVEIPTIEITEPESWQNVDEAIRKLDQYDWIVFTSANAVDAFSERTQGMPLPQVAVVGRQTARRAASRGIHVSLIPENYRSEGILDVFPVDMRGVRLLLPRGDIAGAELPIALRARGAEVDTVTVYRTRVPAKGGAELRRYLEDVGVDCVTFTSGSTVRNLIVMLGANPEACLARTAIAVIGPVTRQDVQNAGLDVAVEPDEATIPALVDAVCRYFSNRP
jgi:uroporphyrinogen III methyltransferase/synthase